VHGPRSRHPGQLDSKLRSPALGRCRKCPKKRPG
jgi:hypothetical protein